MLKCLFYNFTRNLNIHTDKKQAMQNNAEKLFLEFFKEGLEFTGTTSHNIQVIFDDFEYMMLPRKYEALSIYPPMIAVYDENRLYVVKRWVKACVNEYFPTLMRNLAYYYAYGFWEYNTNGIKIKPYPGNVEAISAGFGLCLLNGVPVDLLPFIKPDKIVEILRKFTGKDYSLTKGIAPDGSTGYLLRLSNYENNILAAKLKNIRNNNKALKPSTATDKGSKENPFDNIEDAIEYIKAWEEHAVANDLFANSEFVNDRYRYNIFETPNTSNPNRGFFALPWASSYTAHVKNDFPKNSFIVTQLSTIGNNLSWLFDNKMRGILPKFSLKPNLYKRKFLFRGQYEEFEEEIDGKRYPTCKPNIYRGNIIKNPLPHRIKAYEMGCLICKHPLVELLGVNGVTIFNEPFRFQLNLKGLAQHYYNKTTLLDLTSDIDVAKFFATCQYNPAKDNYIPYAADDKLGVIYIYDIQMPDAFRQHTRPQLSTIGKQYVFARSAMQSGFLLDMPSGLNLHELPNVHRIYFRHSQKISEEVCKECKNGDKYFPKDNLSAYWKDLRDSPNSSFKISIKAREMYLQLHSNEIDSMEELNKQLKEEGFLIGENLWPTFPDDILTEYYKNAPTLWKEFCSDIYFLGEEGIFMKQALENLPNDKRYKWAFYK